MQTEKAKRDYNKKWRQEHKEEIKSSNKKYKQNNKERIKAFNKKYNQEKFKTYRQENKEKFKIIWTRYNQKHKEEQKNYRLEHIEEIKAYREKYNQEHKEEKKAYNKAYRQNHTKEAKAYRQKNKEKLAESNKIWREKNKEKVIIYNREKHYRYRDNPGYTLNYKLSRGIRDALNGNKDGYHWESLVPYTIKDLMKHLDYKNHREKHIDHIIPKSWFNYENPEDREFQIAWALDNLQMLPASVNCSKNNKGSIEILINYLLKIL